MLVSSLVASCGVRHNERLTRAGHGGKRHMVLRIHFSQDDLAGSSVATTTDPLWEVLLSGFRLRAGDRMPELDDWARAVHSDHTRARRLGPGARLLPVLARRGPYIPDFLTPPEGKDGLEAGLEAIMSTPSRRLRHELDRLAQRSPLPDWVRPLSEGNVLFLRRLTLELRIYHDIAIAPYQEVIQDRVDTDRASRDLEMTDQGIGGMFGSLRCGMRWVPPVLEVDYRTDKDLHLNGRGLRIVPSFFSRGTADSLADTSLPPILVFPVDPARQPTATGGRRSLKALMGGTRAAVLYAVGTGATTTELAHRLGTSLTSVSRHTSVLREAGLITTHRQGVAVLHMLTPLGAALLHGQLPT